MAYADTESTRWDSYGMKVEPLSSRLQWMVCPGNHENQLHFSGLSRHLRIRLGDIISSHRASMLPTCTSRGTSSGSNSSRRQEEQEQWLC